MIRLEDIKEDTILRGVDPSQAVRVVRVDRLSDQTISLTYKTEGGQIHETMLFRTDEPSLMVLEEGRPWSFDADGEAYKLAAEAYRINLAYLFDPMMAVHTSTIEPLPHQIAAVYQSMLPRQPLRYLLADDPGAGKTIMAGLFIRELLMRADAERILIIAPGSLVEQWQDELYEKFGLEFQIFSRDKLEQSRSGNPFDEKNQLIARLDQLSRNDDLKGLLEHTLWDLVIVDEAHKMSAPYSGNQIRPTLRFELGQLIGKKTRHLLLMTATPHNGKEEDFQAFLSLLDSDRFYGKPRGGPNTIVHSDLMHRMVKEDLVTFEGKPLFPKRMAYTVNYTLSDPEITLYENVTLYVREEMNKADQIEDGARKGSVGFALTSLQRRLASSPEAIYQSLQRRHKRLQTRIDEMKTIARGSSSVGVLEGLSHPRYYEDAEEEMTSEEYEDYEEKVVDQATASRTIAELQAEVDNLARLEEQAKKVVRSGQDKKWEELSRLLQETPEMRDADGRQRKLIIFTEYKDTLNYLLERIRGVLGSVDAVVAIHGSIKRKERRRTQEIFRNHPIARVLVATDAAGEGVNLQNANLMINYDLPWNPNRLEQRFGRIHRIGQTEVCHLWNLVAKETREGMVFQRLFEKLEAEREALGGRVFDILGEVFEQRSLKELLIEAIRYGDDPAIRDRLNQIVDTSLDTRNLKEIMKRTALCTDVMTKEQLFAVKEEMEKAEARKFQPYFIRSFFLQAFTRYGGEIREREEGRWEITFVPLIIREQGSRIRGRDRYTQNEVIDEYERICFEKQYVRLTEKIGAPLASLIHPGHPLMQALVSLILELHRSTLRQGTVFIDPTDPGTDPKVLLILDHAIREGSIPDRKVSRRMHFITMNESGAASDAGYAPHLDLEPFSSEYQAVLDGILTAPWITGDLEKKSLSYALEKIVPEHINEVSTRREAEIDKIHAAVRERLVKEINFQSDRKIKLEEDRQAGKEVTQKLNSVNKILKNLNDRLTSRERELQAMRHIIAEPPKIAGAALIIPAGLLPGKKPEATPPVDPEARARIEAVAMQAVRETEERLGCRVIDVSKENCGWDLTSIRLSPDGQILSEWHIEVKGRAKGQNTITVSKNEILYGLNQGDKFLLAIVIVGEDGYEGPYYVRHPFSQEPDWAEVSKNLDLGALIRRAEVRGAL